MTNDDPIREPETLFQKIKGLFKKKTHSVEFEYEIKKLCDDFNNSADAFKNFGISAEDASERIIRFSKILTPNEMRELIERRKQW